MLPLVPITLGGKMQLSRRHTAARRYTWISLPFLAPLYWLFIPDQAWAVQLHGGAEGYVVHQMAHLFLGAALIFLLYVLHKRPPGTGSPWKHFKISLLLFLLWDLDTTAVHWLATRLPEESLVTAGPLLTGDRILLPDSWLWRFYYAGSLDHLLCVPAIWFLVLSLKGLGVEILQRQRPSQTGP